MKFNIKKWFLIFGVLATSFAVSSVQADEPGTANGEWHHYTGDIKGSRYSPLSQVTADNFEDLELVVVFFNKKPRYT